MEAFPLLIVGHGSMGSIFSRILSRWIPLHILGRHPTQDREIFLTPEALPAHEYRMILLCIRDEQVLETLEILKDWIGEDTILVSIAPNVSLSSLEKFSPFSVRALPNLGVRVGQGLILAVPSRGLPEEMRDEVTDLFSRCSLFDWVGSEDLLERAAALVFAGPAYALLLADLMGDAGRALALPPDLVLEWTNATLQGTLEYLIQTKEAPAKVLTETLFSRAALSALEVLDPEELGDRFVQAFHAAYAEMRCQRALQFAKDEAMRVA